MVEQEFDLHKYEDRLPEWSQFVEVTLFEEVYAHELAPVPDCVGVLMALEDSRLESCD